MVYLPTFTVKINHSNMLYMDGVGMVSLSQLIHHPSYTAGPSCGEGSDPEKVFLKGIWKFSLLWSYTYYWDGICIHKNQMYIYIYIIYTHPKI